jgi:hypothetical protein
MNTSRILTIVFVLLLVTSVGVAYYRYMVQENFLVKYQTPCNPATESCFVYECDPEAEECTGNPEEDTTYYSLMYRLAKNIPACDVNVEGDCDAAYTCAAGEQKCEIVVCNDDTSLEEESACTNPEDFVIEEEEGTEAEVMEEEVVPAEETPVEGTDSEQPASEVTPAPAMEPAPSTPPTTEPGLERQ